MPVVPAVAAALAVAIACGSLSAGYWLRGMRADRELAELRTQHASQLATQIDAALRASEEARREEARRAFAMEGVARDARTQAEQARRDAVAADDAARRLRDHAARLAAQCARPAAVHPAATVASPPAAGPGLVLADLRDRADQVAGELAAAVDRSRIAGLACERAYDSLTAR